MVSEASSILCFANLSMLMTFCFYIVSYIHLYLHYFTINKCLCGTWTFTSFTSDFVAVVRDVFKEELQRKKIDPRAMLFAANDITDFVEPPSFKHSVKILNIFLFNQFFLKSIQCTWLWKFNIWHLQMYLIFALPKLDLERKLISQLNNKMILCFACRSATSIVLVMSTVRFAMTGTGYS